MNRSLSSFLVAAVALSACDAPPAMTAVAAVQMPTLVPLRARAAVDEGDSDRSETIRLVVALKLRAAEKAKALVAASPLAPEEFADRHGRTVEEYQSVLDYFQAQGLRVVRTSPGRATVTVEGEAPAVERALGVSLHQYHDVTGVFRAPTTDPRASELVAPLIAGVAGLDDSNRWYSHRVQPPASPRANPPAGYGPSDIRTLYGIDTVTQHGEGETVAILGAGEPPSPSTDVAAYLLQFNQTPLAATQYTQVLVGGANRDGRDQGEYGENVLDVECVLATAPLANIVHVLVATNTPGLFTDGIDYIVNQVPQAHAVTLSYGSCERNSAADMPVLNVLLAEARAQGQQWFVAAGDDGTDGCSDGQGNTVLSVGWPGSSQSVIGVGGTQIETAKIEEAWGGANASGGGGGGGVSEDIEKPAYQIGVGPGASDGARDTPDVSALAGDPGFETVSGGRSEPAMGTSAASPMWAGAWALVDQAAGGHGLPAGIESLYALGKANQGFNDITTGNISDGTTPGFSAQAGYDLATGWGSPNVASLIANWK